MDVEKFPYRLDQPTREFLTDLLHALSKHGVRLQHPSRKPFSLLFDKEPGEGPSRDLAYSMTPEAIHMSLGLTPIARGDPSSSAWLRRYHNYLMSTRKKNLVPVTDRCVVDIKLFYDGRLEYYFTYVCQYEESYGDLEMVSEPASKLYARDMLSVQQPARKRQKSPRQQEEPAAWLDNEPESPKGE